MHYEKSFFKNSFSVIFEKRWRKREELVLTEDLSAVMIMMGEWVKGFKFNFSKNFLSVIFWAALVSIKTTAEKLFMVILRVRQTGLGGISLKAVIFKSFAGIFSSGWSASEIEFRFVEFLLAVLSLLSLKFEFLRLEKFELLL